MDRRDFLKGSLFAGLSALIVPPKLIMPVKELIGPEKIVDSPMGPVLTLRGNVSVSKEQRTMWSGNMAPGIDEPIPIGPPKITVSLEQVGVSNQKTRQMMDLFCQGDPVTVRFFMGEKYYPKDQRNSKYMMGEFMLDDVREKWNGIYGYDVLLSVWSTDKEVRELSEQDQS